MMVTKLVLTLNAFEAGTTCAPHALVDITVKAREELGHEREVRLYQDRESGIGKSFQADYMAKIKKMSLGSTQDADSCWKTSDGMLLGV